MLELQNLKKTFGSLTAVDEVSFKIQDGEIMGIIGQNGAGKTTVFRLILNFLTADKGTVLWNGHPLKKTDYDIIGYLPEERGLYPVNASLLEEGIKELKQQGACVIFSSHDMNNVEEICDSLIMLRNGKVVLEGQVHDIREKFGRTKVFLETTLSDETLLQQPGVINPKKTKDGLTLLDLSDPKHGKELFETVTRDGYIPTFSQQPPTLEEIFRMKAEVPNE